MANTNCFSMQSCKKTHAKLSAFCPLVCLFFFLFSGATQTTWSFRIKTQRLMRKVWKCRCKNFFKSYSSVGIFSSFYEDFFKAQPLAGISLDEFPFQEFFSGTKSPSPPPTPPNPLWLFLMVLKYKNILQREFSRKYEVKRRELYMNDFQVLKAFTC